MSNARLLEAFFGTDPYDDFDHTAYPKDLQGWGADNPVLYDAVRLLKPEVVVEVGTWKGAGAVRLAKTLKGLGLSSVVICVDTWLGGPEHFLDKSRPEFFPSLNMRHGYPTLYYQFLANVKHAGMQNVITPLPQTSSSAAIILKLMGIRPELVYVDAGHEFSDVYPDLNNYWDLLARRGVLIGDDYHAEWPGVVRAARLFAAERGVELYLFKEKFVLHKSRPVGLPGLVADNGQYWDHEKRDYVPLPAKQLFQDQA